MRICQPSVTQRSAQIFVWLLVGIGPVSADSPREPFDKTIAPILAANCLECHNAAEQEGNLDLTRAKTAMAGGDSGPAIVPGDLKKSYLWERIANNEMPPKHPLSDGDKHRLKKWIEEGARWGTEPIDPFRFTTDKRAGYDWWALQPLKTVPPVLPADARSREFVRNPIDGFIRAGQIAKNLSPAPEADRRTLIRRLSFDVRGLPPTMAEIRAFEDDFSPGAYERLVDRFLSSPEYGERWARHWLDLARFGESQGFERDKLRTNSWRYRDWVVEALNADLPYDVFARMQIAGDVLFPDDPRATIATSFLVAGPYDEVGQNQQSAAMKAVVRQDEMEDIVGTVGQTFLGLTINCARCHDHKFDPITQPEYYQFVAALAGVRHGQPKVVQGELALEAEIAIAGLSARIAGLNAERKRIEDPLRAQILAERKPVKPVAPPVPVAQWEFDGDLKDSLGGLHGTGHNNARIEDGRLVLDGKSHISTEPLAKELSEKTLEAWVVVSGLDQRGGGVFSVQSSDGGLFDAIVFGEREPRQWLAGSNFFVRTEPFQGEEETLEGKPIHIAITYAKDGTVTAYRNGRRYGKAYKSQGPLSFAAGTSQILFGLRHSPPGGNKFFTGKIDRARLYDRSLSPEEIAASAGVPNASVSEAELAGRMTAEQRDRLASIAFEIEQLKSQQQRFREAAVYAVAPREPEPTHRLARGNTAQPKELVAADGIAAIKSLEPDFGLAPDAPEADRRKKLAAWMTDRQNPLFARVIVNRLWLYHFGVGLVDTPNDFGFNGGRPTHPELLDWLAGELIRQKWSLKAVHRLILTSATYRQSSRFDEAKARIDADNRFLWRMMPKRMEAEALRDAMLFVAEELNPRIGGPGFHDFRTFTRNSQFYEMLDPAGFAFQRRSLYRTWVRSGRSSFLDVFDCPDPSAVAPNRAITTTPLQALSLMNNSFSLRMADRLSERILSEAGPHPELQVRSAYQKTLGREPRREEQAASERFMTKHGLPALCRVLFNSNEFLYVD